MGIAWRDAMTTGVAGLDNDHKRLIVLINIVEVALTESSTEAISNALTELLEYVAAHFAREEAVFTAINYPGIVAHKKLHQDLTAKARLLDAKFRSSKTDEERRKVGSVLNNFLQDWLVNHILKEDLKIKSLVPARHPQQPKPPQEWAHQDRVGMPDDPTPHKMDRNRDIEYAVPPELERLLKRIEYVSPPVPEPESGFESFDKLCEAAINRRIAKVMIFFQRYNPDINRGTAPFFLASPEFAEKFQAAVIKLIFPIIWESRQIRVLSTSFDWAHSDTESFWIHVSKQLQQVILDGWNNGWDNIKLVEAKKGDGSKVLQVKQELKDLRELLQPSSPEAYDLPKIGNREIETFKSLLDPAEDWWDLLNRAWQTCHDLYEQEMDPRVFQQKAREGALRDSLLSAFNRYPEKWVDFLLLACHRVFPRLDSRFLESFTRNLGRNEAEREVHMPYTIRYLRQVAEHPEISKRERVEEDEWKEQMNQLTNFLKGRPLE